jgi:hypothetical protein
MPHKIVVSSGWGQSTVGLGGMFRRGLKDTRLERGSSLCLELAILYAMVAFPH